MQQKFATIESALDAVKSGSIDQLTFRSELRRLLDEPTMHAMPRPRIFSSLAELMQADAAGDVEDDQFERDLHRFMKVLHDSETPADLEPFDEPVVMFHAVQLMNRVLWRGSFAEASRDIPEWFEAAARGYRTLGRQHAAKLVDHAAKLADNVRNHGKTITNIEYAGLATESPGFAAEAEAMVSQALKENSFADFNASVDQHTLFIVNGYIDKVLIQFARDHRATFADIPPPEQNVLPDSSVVSDKGGSTTKWLTPIWRMMNEMGDVRGRLDDDDSRGGGRPPWQHPVEMKKWLSTRGEASIVLEFLAESSLEKKRLKLTDFGSWDTEQLTSERAQRLMVAMGCSENDFWPCHFKTQPDEKYFVFLPDPIDFIDEDRSEFLINGTGDPPFRATVIRLETKALPANLPPCFRAVSRHPDGQPHQELFVTDEFRRAWRTLGYTGADFQQLTER